MSIKKNSRSWLTIALSIMIASVAIIIVYPYQTRWLENSNRVRPSASDPLPGFEQERVASAGQNSAPVREVVGVRVQIVNAVGESVSEARVVLHKSSSGYISPKDIIDERYSDGDGFFSLDGWEDTLVEQGTVTCMANGYIPTDYESGEMRVVLERSVTQGLYVKDVRGAPVEDVAIMLSRVTRESSIAQWKETIPVGAKTSCHVALSDADGRLEYPYLPPGTWFPRCLTKGFVWLNSNANPEVNVEYSDAESPSPITVAPLLAAVIDVRRDDGIEWRLAGMDGLLEPRHKWPQNDVIRECALAQERFGDRLLMVFVGRSASIREGLVADVIFGGAGREEVRYPVKFVPIHLLDRLTPLAIPEANRPNSQMSVGFDILAPDGRKVDGVGLWVRQTSNPNPLSRQLVSSGKSLWLEPGEYALSTLGTYSFLPAKFPRNLVVSPDEDPNWSFQASSVVCKIRVRIRLPGGGTPVYALLWVKAEGFESVLRTAVPENIPVIVSGDSVELTAEVAGFGKTSKLVALSSDTAILDVVIDMNP